MPRVGFEPMIPVFEEGEDGPCLRLRDYCNRPRQPLHTQNSIVETLCKLKTAGWQPTHLHKAYKGHTTTNHLQALIYRRINIKYL
jgi:hypothetical protein